MTVLLGIVVIVVVGAVVARYAWYRHTDEEHSIEGYSSALGTLRDIQQRQAGNGLAQGGPSGSGLNGRQLIHDAEATARLAGGHVKQPAENALPAQHHPVLAHTPGASTPAHLEIGDPEHLVFGEADDPSAFSFHARDDAGGARARWGGMRRLLEAVHTRRALGRHLSRQPRFGSKGPSDGRPMGWGTAVAVAVVVVAAVVIVVASVHPNPTKASSDRTHAAGSSPAARSATTTGRTSTSRVARTRPRQASTSKSTSTTSSRRRSRTTKRGNKGSSTSTTKPPAVLSMVSSTSSAATYQAPNGTYTVAFATTGRCWIEVRSGGSSGAVTWAQTLTSGGSYSFSTQGPLWIQLGAAQLASVTVNGTALALPQGFSSPFDVTLQG